MHLCILVLDDLRVLHDLVVLVLNHFAIVSDLFLKLLSEGAHECTEHLVAIGLRVQVRLKFGHLHLQLVTF